MLEVVRWEVKGYGGVGWRWENGEGNVLETARNVIVNNRRLLTPRRTLCSSPNGFGVPIVLLGNVPCYPGFTPWAVFCRPFRAIYTVYNLLTYNHKPHNLQP